MKKCPFCAEEIQDAAIVCRFCNRDQPLQPAAGLTSSPPLVTNVRVMKFIFIMLGMFAVACLIAYATTGPERAASEARAQKYKATAKAQAAEELSKTMSILTAADNAGIIVRRSCVSNEAHVLTAGWMVLDAVQKKGMTMALAEWCDTQGEGRRIKVIDGRTGRTLAEIKSGSYTVY